jgi:ATP-dependent HslUV protease ATP-binding subunit HslU
VKAAALEAVQENGIVFLDEIDKICARARMHGVPMSAAKACSATCLPLIEGTTVSTKHGPVKTDHILFIASRVRFTSPNRRTCCRSLQGRLPIRVELSNR